MSEDQIEQKIREAANECEILAPLLKQAQVLHDSFLQIYAASTPQWDESSLKNRQWSHEQMNKAMELHSSLFHALAEAKGRTDRRRYMSMAQEAAPSFGPSQIR